MLGTTASPAGLWEALLAHGAGRAAHLAPLVLILICLCCKYILFAFCKLSLKLFLTLLTEAESEGLCLEGLTPLCPLLTSMSVPSFLEWPFTTSPLLPSAVLQLPGADWAQHWGPVQRCLALLITQPESRSQE